MAHSNSTTFAATTTEPQSWRRKKSTSKFQSLLENVNSYQQGSITFDAAELHGRRCFACPFQFIDAGAMLAILKAACVTTTCRFLLIASAVLVCYIIAGDRPGVSGPQCVIAICHVPCQQSLRDRMLELRAYVLDSWGSWFVSPNLADWARLTMPAIQPCIPVVTISLNRDCVHPYVPGPLCLLCCDFPCSIAVVYSL